MAKTESMVPLPVDLIRRLYLLAVLFGPNGSSLTREILDYVGDRIVDPVASDESVDTTNHSGKKEKKLSKKEKKQLRAALQAGTPEVKKKKLKKNK